MEGSASTKLGAVHLAGENLHTHNPTDVIAMGSISELMHLIALGRTVAVLPQSLTTPLRDDLTTIPVTDIPPSVLLLAWPVHSTSPSVAALARAAAKVASAHNTAPALPAPPGCPPSNP